MTDQAGRSYNLGVMDPKKSHKAQHKIQPKVTYRELKPEDIEPAPLPPPAPKKPSFSPDEQQILQIRYLSGLGLPIEDVAIGGQCEVEDLQVGGRFNKEVKRGVSEANQKVAEAIFNRAVSGQSAALTLYAKARMGWSEAGIRDAAEGKKQREIRQVNWLVKDGQKIERISSPSTAPKAPKGSGPLYEARREIGRKLAARRWGNRERQPPEHPDPQVDGAPITPKPVQSGVRRPGVREEPRVRGADDREPHRGSEPEFGLRPGSSEESEPEREEATGTEDSSARGRRLL